MTTKHKYETLIVFLLLLFITSCKKFVTVNPPPDKIDTKAVFRDSANATAAVIGIYIKSVGTSSSLRLLSGSLSVYAGLAADELFISGTSDAGLRALYANSLNKSTDKIASLWKQAYEVIYQTNACIEGINQSTLSASVKRQLTGESKFIRAVNYFYLVNLYSEVPLILTTNYQENALIPKTNKDVIYKQIIEDLKDAEINVSENYVTAGRMRVNKYVTKAFLARVYLYLNRWVDAELSASDVIKNTTLYKLETDLSNIFTTNSMEAILQFQPGTSNAGTSEGYAFIPTSSTATPKYGINKALLDSFEVNDLRRSKWIQKLTKTVSGTQVDYFYPYKYKYGNNAPSPSPENTTVIRLAELFLIRAESRAQQDKVIGANSAESDLNVIRNRAGLPNTKAATKAQMIDSVLKERKIELFCEWGHRWLDLKRTNQISTVMSKITSLKGGNWKDEWQYFPIPVDETNSNPNLKQNSGYE